MVVSSDGDYANAKSLKDFKDAKITAQQGVYLYNLIDQSQVSANKPLWETSVLCAKPLHLVSSIWLCFRASWSKTAEEASSKYKMITLKDGGFQVSGDDDVSLAVGLRKGATANGTVNKVLAGISQENVLNWWITSLTSMQIQTDEAAKKETSLVRWALSSLRIWPTILTWYRNYLLISIIGTVVGTFISLMIGVYCTALRLLINL